MDFSLIVGIFFAIYVIFAVFLTAKLERKLILRDAKITHIKLRLRKIMGWRESDYSGDRSTHAIEFMERGIQKLLDDLEKENGDG